MNYPTALPNFTKMQRSSFCWFISQGLNDELSHFSKIYDFSYNTEYILFGQEYKLVKPVYSLIGAKKYAENYAAHLVIPLEVRNKKFNIIRYYNHFPIIKLPLMTTNATFIINGCERVIVSQIIRSPGIYFEKNKNQKIQKRANCKLILPMNKLVSFFPLGQPWKCDLTINPSIYNSKLKNFEFLSKSIKITKIKYSLSKIIKNKNEFYFLILFKLFRIISKDLNQNRKIKKVKIFLQFLKINCKNNFIDSNINYFVKYWIFLSKILKKTFSYQNLKINSIKQINLNFLISHYIKIIRKTQIISQIKFRDKLTFIYFLNKINNFNFLKNKIKIKQSNKNCILRNKLKSTFYFSTNLKPIFKYQTKKIKNKTKIKQFKKIRKYIKSTNKTIQLKEDYNIQDFYKKKYNKKDLYTATLIPEYGSWIRFSFKKISKSYPYLINNEYEEIAIQLDKLTQKPIIFLLKAMGIEDIEIFNSLQHSDFFYLNKPLLKNIINSNYPLIRLNIKSEYYKNISEFSQIFNPAYYRLGKIGRFKINKRLNLKISQRLLILTYDDIFAIIDKLITLAISKTLQDDIDHLKNRRVRSVGELIQNLFRIGFQRLGRKLRSQTNKTESGHLSSFSILNATIREFFGSSQLSQYMDQTNPLSCLTHKRRISALGPGGLNRDRISFAVRDIHPSHYGRICPIETPEGQNVGLIASLTTCARVNKSGFIETPFWRVINGKVIKTKKPIYLTSDIEDSYKIAPADLITDEKNYLLKNLISVRYNQDFITVSPFEIDFISILPIQVVSVATSLIPFFEHDDANRALMGSNMQRQSVPLLLPQKPIIGTGLENQLAIDSGMAITAEKSGIIQFVTADYILIKEYNGRILKYFLQKYERSNQETCINQRPIVWKGEKVKSGQILSDGPGIASSELALGQNVLVAYMPWQGYNFEDAILISERLVYEDIFTSIHIDRYDIEIDQSDEVSEQITKNIPNLTFKEVRNLNNDGIIKMGTFVNSGDILVGKISSKNDSEQLPETKLLRAIFGAKAKGVRDTSYRLPEGKSGRVIEKLTFNRKTKLVYNFEKIQIFIAQIRKIQVGDKIAGRHGNKGIVSRILSRQDMPFLPDGTAVDIILNPLGVPSRMNVGQLYECLLGFAGDKLNRRFKILPFDEMYAPEISRILINKKLRQASVERNEAWIFNPYSPGKIVLIDGITGKEFENPITVGTAYMLKLIHLVDDKIHSRSTGPYSLITQQPLGGKAQHGGQRFGEMEVWSLEGFGAAFTLKELLTIKSDDMQGRNDTLSSIVKGQQIPSAGIPESFKVLLHELRSLGLDMSTYKIDKFGKNLLNNREINLIESYNSKTKTFPILSNIDNISFY